MRVCLGILICLSFTACATNPVHRVPGSDSLLGKSYVSIDLDVAPFEKIKRDLEISEKINLKSRGEAHITLITPPEMKRLRQVLSSQEIDEVLQESNVLHAPYKQICVGRGRSKNQSTYFVVIEADSFYKFREALYQRFLKNGGTVSTFSPKAFHPHVTVGFTERDLHLEEGVVKDSRSCLYPLKAD